MENIHETHFADDPHCISTPLFEKKTINNHNSISNNHNNINNNNNNKNNLVALNQSDLLDAMLPTISPMIDLIHDLVLPQCWWLSSNFGKVIIKLCLGKQLEHLASVEIINILFCLFHLLMSSEPDSWKIASSSLGYFNSPGDLFLLC